MTKTWMHRNWLSRPLTFQARITAIWPWWTIICHPPSHGPIWNERRTCVSLAQRIPGQVLKQCATHSAVKRAIVASTPSQPDPAQRGELFMACMISCWFDGENPCAHGNRTNTLVWESRNGWPIPPSCAKISVNQQTTCITSGNHCNLATMINHLSAKWQVNGGICLCHCRLPTHQLEKRSLQQLQKDWQLCRSTWKSSSLFGFLFPPLLQKKTKLGKGKARQEQQKTHFFLLFGPHGTKKTKMNHCQLHSAESDACAH